MFANRLVRALGSSVVAALCLSTWLHAAAVAPVADAAMKQDRQTVRALLKQGGDVNAAQGDGMTALHWAAMQGDAELAATLLYAGANTRATTRLGGYTPLHLASRRGNAAVVKTLVENGADVSISTATGATALMLAAASGQVDAVTALVDAGADPNAKEKAYGQTALMFAAAADRADVVRLLVARTADPNVASSFVDLVKLADPMAALFMPPAAGARPPQAGQAQENNAAPAPNGPPSERAQAAPPPSRAGQAGAPAGRPRGPEIAGVTRPFRYNELIGTQGGLTALHYAARQGNMSTVQALVEAGADVDKASPGDRTSPLLIAVINGHFDIAAYLLEHGANPTLANIASVTPLYAVVNVQWAPKAAYPQPRAYEQQKTTYLDLMKALLDKGADPNVRINRKVWFASYNFDQSSIDETGATPFWRAAYAADVNAMQLLVAHGADPRVPTMKGLERRGPDDPDPGKETSSLPPVPVGGPGMTPLHAAAGPGYAKGFAGNSHHFAPGGMMPAVTYLVEDLHADVNARDSEGNTPLHNAASRGDTEMVQYLIAKGADVKAVNRIGQTTIDVANGPVQRVQPYPETITVLEKLGAKNNHKCVSC